MAGLDLAAWDLLVRQAHRAGLLSRLAVLAEELGLKTPGQAVRWFNAAHTIADRQLRAVHWEARKLDQALNREGIPVTLLKGAAYALGDLPAARGRVFGDIDILVPKAALGRVEAALRLHGWHGSHHSAYDQRYYRKWMHELPPLIHIRRQSHLDVHHNLLPETACTKTRPDKVIDSARPLAGFKVLRVPCIEDLILHSATHLFHEGEWGHGLRDLVDLDALLRHGMGREGWWEGLWRRAEQLHLTAHLALATRYAHVLLGTPVPSQMLETSRRSLSFLLWPLRDAMFLRGFSTAHPACRLRGSTFAEFVLYVRSHALRMPLHLLLPHLAYKAWLAFRGPQPDTG
jgi:hypothetical protein